MKSAFRALFCSLNNEYKFTSVFPEQQPILNQENQRFTKINVKPMQEKKNPAYKSINSSSIQNNCI